MMTKMYAAFQGQPSSAPSGSVTPTLALTDIQANIKGENANTTATEEPPSHTKGETEQLRLIDKGKRIATEFNDDPSKKLVKASSIVRPDPDEPVRDKEEQIKKSEEEAWLLEMKAMRKLGKAQDAEHAVLKRQHTKKIRKYLELRKHKYDSYMWTVSSRLKPEPITDIKIHPKTKPVVITVYKGNDGRNFEVHEPFIFGAFGISELDELREIIPKKKNAVVKDLMNSLSRRYKKLQQIPEELGIHPALPAPEQASSRSSGRKRKHMELKPETRIPGLECNRALPENVPFVNNMVNEEPEYGIFFTDEFGDQAFQRWSDIEKVGMEALVSYLVAASMVKSLENARFNMKLRKLIAKHHDQEKLKSKKVKLEALEYKMD
ncbi:hypothetical protein Tco_0359618 [Tanacetum coccineum]